MRQMEIDRINLQIERFIKRTYKYEIIESSAKPHKIMITSRDEDLALFLIFTGLQKLEKYASETRKKLQFSKFPQLGYKGYLGYFFICEIEEL